MSTTAREGQTFEGGSRFVRYANFVKLPHTVFALPFALVGVTLASYRAVVSWQVIAWVVLAFTAARFAAMGFNRIVDRAYDAKNPRTAMREIPSGAMSVREAKALVITALLLFEFAAWKLNFLCYVLSPFALSWVLWYSFTKRFTRWSHLVLGLGLGIAPVGGYLAVTGLWSDPWWMLVALAGAVMCWTGGFDILYALQDIDFDRANGLHSLPAKVGARQSLLIARGFHVMTIVLLALVGYATAEGTIYNIGLGIAAGMLVFEHTLVHADDLSRVDKAFFTVNMALSATFFAFVLAARIWG
jgi:4-hydroxybenzoate polyprenyltransferase